MLVVQLRKQIIAQKISEIGKKVTDHNQDKYITTPEFNQLPAEICATRLAQANLVTKTDLDTKLISLNTKMNSSKTKACTC